MSATVLHPCVRRVDTVAVEVFEPSGEGIDHVVHGHVTSGVFPSVGTGYVESAAHAHEEEYLRLFTTQKHAAFHVSDREVVWCSGVRYRFVVRQDEVQDEVIK